VVTGIADGTHGGSYGLDMTTATPMPEAASDTTLIAGLGLIGFLARRRNRSGKSDNGKLT
jgi:hypothetical protein